MHIEVSTDGGIEGGEALAALIKGLVEHELAHRTDHLTRIEVHLSDVDAGKHGPRDKHCMLEARPEGHQPIVVRNAAPTVEQATRGAAEKLRGALDSTLGKLSDRRRAA